MKATSPEPRFTVHPKGGAWIVYNNGSGRTPRTMRGPGARRRALARADQLNATRPGLLEG